MKAASAVHPDRDKNRVWGSIAALMVIAAFGGFARASSVPAGFVEAPVYRPDGRSWDGAAALSFTSSGRLFVAEKTGRIWLVDPATPVAAPIIDLSSEVSTIGALGLTGMALDPLFDQTGYLYLFYTVDPLHLAQCTAPAAGAPLCPVTFKAGQHATSGATIARLVRYQFVKPGGAADYRAATAINYSSRRVLLGESPAGGGAPAGCVVTDTAHGAGALAFGAEGSLLAGCGDGASANVMDAGSLPGTQYQQALSAGLMTAAENVGAFRAQLVDSLSGKILRLDATTGNGLPTNPFYDSSAPRAARSRVWIVGLHDPQHFAVRPGTGGARPADGRPGTLYIGDVGYAGWESLEVAVTGGANFGWPLYEGVGNDGTAYTALSAFNLTAPNPLFPATCAQRYFRFGELLRPDSPQGVSWPNPCSPSSQLPASDEVFIRERPAIDWLHLGTDARWAALDASGAQVALPLGTPAAGGSVVTGPLFGGTASVGGVWAAASNYPAPYNNGYFHADSGGEWIKAFAFDGTDSPTAVRDFVADAGAINALGMDPATGSLYYVTGPGASEIRALRYTPPRSVAPASGASTSAAIASAAPPSTSTPATNSALVSSAATASTTPAPMATVHIASVNSAVTPLSTGSGSPCAPWSNGDIGSVAAVGSCALSNGVFTVNGSGADIWNSADAFQFVSEAVMGDGSITARVVSQTNTSGFAKAGVMIRETLAAGATNAIMEITPSNGARLQARTTTGASSVSTLGPLVTAPYWVRVTRASGTFTGYISPDGVSWTPVGQYAITMASQAYVGLAVTSHDNGVLSTAVIDNVTVTAAVAAPDTQAPTLPTGLAATNITANSIAISWNASTDLPNPGGTGVGGYYVYRNGNTTTPYATVTSGTSFTDTGLSPGTAYSYQVASFDKATPANVSTPSTALSLTTQNVVSSSSWTSGDIGSVAPAGSYTLSNGVYTVNGSGADIWNSADAFQFVSEALLGDGSITARVVSQTNTSGFAKAGVMIRETLAAGATNAIMEITPSNGARFQARTTTGASSLSAQGPIVTAPYWVRVVRLGGTFTGYVSPDGVKWTQVGQYAITMASQAYVGLAVTSHDNGVSSTAVFDNVTVTDAVTPFDTQAPTLPTGLAATNITANSVAISWNASTDLPSAGGTGVGGYYVYRNGNTTTPYATVTSGASFTDTGLTPATAYSYQVAAFDNATPANVSAPSSPALTVTTSAAPPPGVLDQRRHRQRGAGRLLHASAMASTRSMAPVPTSGTSADAFQFVSEAVMGDGSITARVVSQTNTSGFAKAGVMIRETLAAGATNAFMEITPSNGARLQARTTTGASSVSTLGPLVSAPYWVRVTRASGIFTGYISPDGVSWTPVGQYAIAMASQAYVGLAVTSHDNGVLSTAVIDNVTVTATVAPRDTQAPTLPTGLAATGITANSIAISWNASTDLPNPGGTGVGGYYVYRNGNTTTPYATVKSGTSFTDTGLTPATAYSYQVAAFDRATPANVSTPSTALSLTTEIVVASPSWTNGDIGSVAPAGSYTVTSGVFTVNGSGADIWNSADAFQFISEAMMGDGSITARVVSQTNTSGFAKAGVMIRETLAAGATNAFMEITPGNGAWLQARTTTGASTVSTQYPLVTTPYWVRVTRLGGAFNGYVSPDGVSWTPVAQYAITMASQAYVGLAVTSHENGVLNTAVFDNITVTTVAAPDTQAPTLPTGLAATNITANSIAISWNASTDLPNPGGTGVGGYYVYRNGNTTTPYATVTSGTSFTDTGLSPGTAYSYQVASFDKATPANVSTPSTALSLTTQNVVSSSSWTSGDIGSVAPAGSYTLSNGVYTVNGSGADIWNSADAFQFVSEALLGDGSITARVVSQTNTSGFAKAGVMIRETLAAGATHAAVELTPRNGALFQARTTTGDNAVDTQGPIVTAPYWVRVVRLGGTFTGYVSPDGVKWTQVGQYAITMASQAYVGLAVTSHDNGVSSTAVFDNVTVTDAVTPFDTQAPTLPTGLAATNITANSVAISWNASTDLPSAGGTGVGGYYVYRNGNTTTPYATVTSGASFTDTGLTPATAYSYQVAAFDNATPANVSAPSSPAFSVATAPPDTQAPTVPAGLTATGITANSVALSWNASTDLPNPGGTGVGGYYVYRNGNTTPIATVTGGTSYTDTGLTPATAYSYQVAAFDNATPQNISTFSAALSVTSQNLLVSPTWTNGDIGSVAPAGSYAINNGTFTVNGSGADIWNSADAFQFVAEALMGDGSITARVVSQTNTNAFAKAGVMIRETLAAGATNAMMAITPSSGARFQSRTTTGASSVSTQGPAVNAPYWVRVVRASGIFTGYVSPDGVTWTPVSQYAITMAPQAYVGLAVTSHANGVLSTAVFDNVTTAGAVSVSPNAASVVVGGQEQFTAQRGFQLQCPGDLAGKRGWRWIGHHGSNRFDGPSTRRRPPWRRRQRISLFLQYRRRARPRLATHRSRFQTRLCPH